MIMIDTTIVNVALGPIVADLGGSLSGAQWIVSGYTITFGVGDGDHPTVTGRATARSDARALIGMVVTPVIVRITRQSYLTVRSDPGTVP